MKSNQVSALLKIACTFEKYQTSITSLALIIHCESNNEPTVYHDAFDQIVRHKKCVRYTNTNTQGPISSGWIGL